MSNHQQAIFDYFKEYRQKRQLLQDLNQEISNDRKAVERKSRQAIDLSTEILSMQKIITAMIENDMDPVEIKMRNDLADLTDTLWIDHNTAKGQLTVSSLTPSYTMTSALPATSAINTPAPLQHGTLMSKSTIK